MLGFRKSILGFRSNPSNPSRPRFVFVTIFCKSGGWGWSELLSIGGILIKGGLFSSVHLVVLVFSVDLVVSSVSGGH